MTTITEKQYESLTSAIYTLLMSGTEIGLGDMGDCMDASQSTVDEWMKNEEIIIWY